MPDELRSGKRTQLGCMPGQHFLFYVLWIDGTGTFAGPAAIQSTSSVWTTKFRVALGVGKLAQPNVTAAVQHVLRELPLVLEELVQLFIEGDKVLRHHDRIVNKNIPGLADPVAAVGSLILSCRIPGAGEMDHVVRCLNIHPGFC